MYSVKSPPLQMAPTGRMGQYKPKTAKSYPVQGRGTLQDLPRSVVRPIPPAYRDEFGKPTRPGQRSTVRDDLMKAIVTSKQKGMDAMKGRGY